MDFNSLNITGMLETADSYSYKPIEMFNQDSISSGLTRNIRQSSPVTASVLEELVLDAPRMLPFAAEKYRISAKLQDYVMVPVVIMPTDLPNRNMVSFPYLELSSFVPNAGQISYQTWKWKPTHVEHVNRDWTIAKGLILDSALLPMPGRAGNLWKTLCLCAFDRGKDAALANDILTGRRKNYSMGAMVSHYSCSVCGSVSEPGKGKQLPCGNRHIDPKSGVFKVFDTAQGKILGHYNAHEIQGFEVSSVGVPAWPSAVTDHELHLSF